MDLLAFLPMLLILGAFMFFASRRQRKAMHATINLHESLRVGDRIRTTSGLEGIIKGLTDDGVDLEIAPGVVTHWLKLAVRDRVDPVDDMPTSDATDSTPATEITEITESTGTFGSVGTTDEDISSNRDRR